MENLPFVLYLWTLWLLVFIFGFASSYKDLKASDNPSITYTYSRFSEIEKQCGFLLSSASELEPDDNRGDRIKKELFFLNGDWYQESGGAPLMPFDDRDTPSNSLGNGSPLKLVSFRVMNVDPVRRAKHTVSVSAALEIAITRSRLYSSKPYQWSPNFYMAQGISSLTILFEGIYIETEDNGGERLMCLLGNATMPTSSQFVDPLESMNEYGYEYSFEYKNKSPLVTDDQILLVLRYPKTFTLRTRDIHGEMQSLIQKWNLTYFDKIHISSQLGSNSHYQFGAEDLLSKACSPYPHRDNLVVDKVKMFKRDGLCKLLRGVVLNEIFNFMPNSECIGWKDYHGKLGPFVLDRNIEADNGDFNHFKLIIQNLLCEPENDENEMKAARVAAVFRVFSSSEQREREGERTGLSSMTLSVEGIWHSSDGQLCMVGCLGQVGAPSDICNYRICLHISLTFSIKQRSMVFGTISSINETDLHPSLMFDIVAHPKYFSNNLYWSRNLTCSYNYSKIMQASQFQKRSEPSKLGTIFRKSFLLYPSPKGNDEASFSFLSDVLSYHLCAESRKLLYAQTCVEIMVLSLGSSCGRFWSHVHEEKHEIGKPVYSNAGTIEISGHLSFTGQQSNSLSLRFEGLYNTIVGEMYLIGCRDSRSFQKFIYNATKLEGGMDCLIEVKIKYPPRNARWLLNPKIKVSVVSKRNEADPLYLSPINLDSFLGSYEKQDDVIFGKGFESVLRILLLTVAILCTLCQSLYTRNTGHHTAYTSLVMLGVHALGYTIPLITSVEVLFNWKAYRYYYGTEVYNFEKFYWFEVLDFAIKTLLLIALLITVKLYEKVLESRSRQLAHGNIGKTRIPSDKLVFLITFAIHIIGFSIFCVIREMHASQAFIQPGNCMCAENNIKKLRRWLILLDKYSGLVHDFFLLPQIVGNTLWHIQGKPLRKSYYLGFTMVRILIHMYDYVRDRIPNDRHINYEFQELSLDLYSKLGHITVATMVLVLSVIVYFQQKSNYQKHCQTEKPEECEDLGLKSDLHESLLPE